MPIHMDHNHHDWATRCTWYDREGDPATRCAAAPIKGSPGKSLCAVHDVAQNRLTMAPNDFSEWNAQRGK